MSGSAQIVMREHMEGVPRVLEGQCDRYTAAESVRSAAKLYKVVRSAAK
jgi:hypothetical protein